MYPSKKTMDAKMSERRTQMSIYDFKATTIDGEEKDLQDYKDKVLLIVNVASK